MLIHPAMFSFSYPNGEPQTPTRTPTTAALDSFTPKLESSFFDPRVTWDTADPYASSPEFLRSPQKFALGHPSNPLKTEAHRAGDTAGLKDARLSEQTDTVRRTRPVRPCRRWVRMARERWTQPSLPPQCRHHPPPVHPGGRSPTLILSTVSGEALLPAWVVTSKPPVVCWGNPRGCLAISSRPPISFSWPR